MLSLRRSLARLGLASGLVFLLACSSDATDETSTPGAGQGGASGQSAGGAGPGGQSPAGAAGSVAGSAGSSGHLSGGAAGQGAAGASGNLAGGAGQAGKAGSGMAGGSGIAGASGGDGGMGGAGAAGQGGGPAGGMGGASTGTRFGVRVVLDQPKVADEIKVVESLGATYVRLTIHFDATQSTGEGAYKLYVQSGKRVVLNLSWGAQGGPFVTPDQIPVYKQRLGEILDSIPAPEVVVIENEEINPAFHQGPISDYTNMLAAAAEVVHQRKLPLTNGAVYGVWLNTLVYRHLQQDHGQAAADAFGAIAFGPKALPGVMNPGTNAMLEQVVGEVDAVLTAAIQSNLDYVNIHYYEVNNPNIADADVPAVTTANIGMLAALKEYVEHHTGRPIMSNETSIRANKQPALVTSLLQDFLDTQYPYVIWWDNNDGNKYQDEPLTDGAAPFALRSNGVAFRDFVTAFSAQP